MLQLGKLRGSMCRSSIGDQCCWKCGTGSNTSMPGAVLDCHDHVERLSAATDEVVLRRREHRIESAEQHVLEIEARIASAIRGGGRQRRAQSEQRRFG